MWQNTQVAVLGAFFSDLSKLDIFSVDKGLPNETSSGGFLRKPRFIRKVLMGFSLLFARVYRISITCEAKVKEKHEFIFERTVFRRHILWKFSFRELPLRKISSFAISKKGAQTGIDFVAQEKKQLILHPCFIPGTAN